MRPSRAACAAQTAPANPSDNRVTHFPQKAIGALIGALVYRYEISYLKKYGKVAERFKAAVLKTADGESCP